MKKRFATIYAILCTLLLAAGFLLVFFFAWREGTRQIIGCIVGIVIGFIFAPIVHESGHLTFGKAADMQSVYAKAFCFKRERVNGKARFSFASPFAADQTQMIPKRGGDMRRRALIYTVGGLVFSGLFALTALTVCLIFDNFVAWGSLPYAGYLFFLNAMPVEYAGGKTDVAVVRGIRKGYDSEKCMLAAMEIQGQLFEGKSFGEIDESLYFNLPQLAEDEPLYALLLDLRYRYYLDIEDMEGAADCLNRLAISQAYLPDGEVEKLAGELVYLHALRGDLERAEACGKLCQEYLSGESVAAKRILAAYSFAIGKAGEGNLLKEQGVRLLEREYVAGVKKLEEKLLERIKA